MTGATVAFLRTLSLFALMVVCPVASPAVDPMIVGVSGPSINMMYAFVTRDAGLWQKHNSDPRVVLFEAGSILAQAMLSGEVKMSISSGPAVIASRSQGAETIIVAAFVNTLPYSLVSAKAITTWDQLKGKRIAISRFGSGTDTAIRLALRKFGLDPLKDVTILQIGSQPDRVRALAAGSIDATLVSPPLDLSAKKQGYNILVNLADLGIAYPQQVIETTDRFIRENPQGVKNFLKGFIEGVRYAGTYKDETKKLIAKYLKIADAELLEATYQSYVQVTEYSGYPNMEGVRNAMDEVAQRVAVVKSKKPEDFVNTRFLKELEKEGFFKNLSGTIRSPSSSARIPKLRGNAAHRRLDESFGDHFRLASVVECHRLSPENLLAATRAARRRPFHHRQRPCGHRKRSGLNLCRWKFALGVTAKELFIALIGALTIAEPAVHGQFFESDSKRLGGSKMEIVVREIERRDRSSVVEIKITNIGSSVGSSFFLLCSLRQLALERGGYRYIVKIEEQPKRGQMLVGFLRSPAEGLALLGKEFSAITANDAVIDLEQFAEICAKMK